MTITKVLSLTLALSCFFTVPTYAGHHRDTSHDTINDANSQSRILALDLYPWFTELEVKIRQQPEYRSISEVFVEHHLNDENFVCTFSLSKTGDISDFRFTDVSDENFRNKVISLLTKAAPFTSLPNNLPIERGIQIEFWNDSGHLQCGANLNRNTEGKIFTAVDYIKCGEEHPWWKFAKKGIGSTGATSARQ